MTLIEGSHRRYRRDGCGKESVWQDSWRCYSSIALEEACVMDVPTLCSDGCQEVFQRRMKVGEISVPTVKPRGYGYQIVGERRGY